MRSHRRRFFQLYKLSFQLSTRNRNLTFESDPHEKEKQNKQIVDVCAVLPSVNREENMSKTGGNSHIGDFQVAGVSALC